MGARRTERIAAAAALLLMAAPGASAQTRGQVERAVQAARAEFLVDYPQVRGTAIAVVVPDGDRLRTQIFTSGTRDRLRPGAHVRPSTLFELGSVTKVFTTALMTDAEARGLLSRTDTVQSRVPNGTTVPASKTVNGTTTACPQAMTLADLASHRAGFRQAFTPFTAEDRSSLTAAQLYDKVEDEQLLFCPHEGTKYEYSNIGMGLLGTLVARASVTPYGTLVSERIAGPLKMRSTRLERESGRLSDGYGEGGGKADPWLNVGAMAGGGGLMSTASDMARFVRGHLGEGPAEVVAALRETRDEVLAPGDNGLGRTLGWTSRAADGLGDDKYYYKNGGTLGFSTLVVVVPGRRFGMAILANGRYAYANLMAQRITSDLLGASLDAPNDD